MAKKQVGRPKEYDYAKIDTLLRTIIEFEMHGVSIKDIQEEFSISRSQLMRRKKLLKSQMGYK